MGALGVAAVGFLSLSGWLEEAARAQAQERVARRGPGDHDWTLLPGIFTVPATVVTDVALGHVAQSTEPSYSIPSAPVLPVRCPRGSGEAGK